MSSSRISVAGDSRDTDIPAGLAEVIRLTRGGALTVAGGAARRRWIEGVPALIGAMVRRWNLTLDSQRVYYGYTGLVLLVRREGEPLALKLTVPDDGIAEEARALEAWNGHGMVQMIEVEASRGGMLLERLDPARTLTMLPPLEAAAVAGRLLRHLAIPAPPGFRSMRTLVGDAGRSLTDRDARLGNPIPAGLVRMAAELSAYLEGNAGTHSLIHTDLHYGNILAGAREPWLAIDPRAAAGEPEASVPELMWTRVDSIASRESIRRLLTVLAAAGDLDLDRTRQWVIVRCVDYLLWGLEHGLTEDPKRCRRILEAMV
jgi:streptomycin 6-kinase